MYCVYKLTDKNGLVYYGSSKNPDKRLKKHKYGDYCCSNNLDKETMKMSIMEDRIATKEDAVCLERYYFDNNVCVNFNKPILSEDERKGTRIATRTSSAIATPTNIKPKSKALLKKIKETETVAEKKKRIIELNRKQKIAISKKGKKNILTKDGHILV